MAAVTDAGRDVVHEEPDRDVDGLGDLRVRQGPRRRQDDELRVRDGLDRGRLPAEEDAGCLPGSVPKRPPLIVTVSPPAQLPDVGSIDEMNGPFDGTGWYSIDFSAEPHSKVALTFERPDEVAPSVTSANPFWVTFDTLGSPVSRKKPKSVVKSDGRPVGDGRRRPSSPWRGG